MDLKSLNYFVQAAETLNFTKAAKNCYISQTAISLSIAKMEDELGFQLFERNNRSMRLTPAGRDFYEWSKQTLHSYEKAVETGQNIANGYTGMIKIGFSSTFEALWFIPQLQAFRKRFADVHMEQLITDAPNLLTALQNKDIDAIVSPPYDYLGNKNLSIQDIAQFPMILVLGKHHPLTKLEKIPVPMLREQSCVILTYQGMPQAESHFTQMCHDHDIHFKELRQMNHLEEILLYLINNNAVAFLPGFIANYLNDFVVARPLSNCNMRLAFSFTHLKSNKNPALSALDLALQQNYAKCD